MLIGITSLTQSIFSIIMGETTSHGAMQHYQEQVTMGTSLV